MLKRMTSHLAALALAVLLGACATPATQTGEIEIRTGVIEEISTVQLQGNHPTGVGAVVGGVAGLGIGSLIGGGSGRDVAMVLGAIGGAFAGNEIQKKYDQPQTGQQIIVRTATGVLVSVTQPVNTRLTKGQKVYIEGSGDDARVVPR